MLQKILEDLPKNTSNQSPLAEIEYWRERYLSLNNLNEQLNAPDVQKIISIYNQKDNTINSLKDNLIKLNIEAKDNVRFLSTLERFFKNLTYSNFYVISRTIPSMMTTLRMIWIISRHYNTDKRMVPLLERIAWQLVDRVEMSINFKTIFK